MAQILNIETSTEVCSVCLSKNGDAVFTIDDDNSNSHSKKLILIIEEILKKNNTNLSEIDAFAISYGPGSYTGLRIGMATAKALCYATNKPLITISSLLSLANGVIEKKEEILEPAIIIPMIDARRMEVYIGFYDSALNEIEPISSEIMDEHSFDKYIEYSTIYITGNGAEKCKPLFVGKNNLVFCDSKTSAKNMAQIAEKEFQQNNFADLAYCEPFYLKDYIAGKPNVKGLR